MTVTISPSKATGTVVAPPSKSMAHRLLICAGLCPCESKVTGVSYSQDVLATLDCLEALGAEYRTEGDTVYIKGVDPLKNQGNGELNCRECGSTLRFMIPICLLCGEEKTLCGSQKLMSRPLSVYEQIAKENGLLFDMSSSKLAVKGPLCAGDYTVPGNISSQFISGLLFALPLLEQDSTITMIEPVESKAYIDMTIAALKLFGINIKKEKNVIYIDGSQQYKSRNVKVEGDYSNAAFLEALNMTGGSVSVEGLDKDSIQGDKIYADLFKKIRNGYCSIDISDCPDLGPVLFAAAALNHGAEFTGTARLKIKESDRAAAMASELKKFGTEVILTENTATVKGQMIKRPSEVLSSHNDHRIVMSLSVILTKTGGTICDAEAVNKSYPDFFDKLKDLNVEVEYNGIDKQD